MAHENQQNDDGQQNGLPPQPMASHPGLGAKGASRRRFARAGAGVTGVLMTLASHPGMACSIKQGPSGWHSAYVAQKNGIAVSHRVTLPSSGLPPSRWCGRQDGPCPTTAKFGSLFFCNSSNVKLRYTTLEALFSGKSGLSGEKITIATLVAAAYFNFKTGRSPFLSEEILRNIWNEYQRKGTYAPMAGVPPWNAMTIYTYLSGTMD